MKRGSYSFQQWCIDNNKRWLLDWWCYDLNSVTPDLVPFKSNNKYYFWCGDKLHVPFQLLVCGITGNHYVLEKEKLCVGCKSVGKYFDDNYSHSLLEQMWSDKNEISPYEVSVGSGKRIWLKCLNDDTHPDYDIHAYNIRNSISCPYCAGKRVCETNSLGYSYPEVLDIWSDLNELTPYDYTQSSNSVVYMKCPDGKHNDFKRKICAHIRYGLRCPECSAEIFKPPSGKDSPNWNPYLPEDRRIRKSEEYSQWRTSVFERDHYMCQCCLDKNNNKLNAHHIYAYAYYKNLRFVIANGITLCRDCHDSTIAGSLHNMYGTRDITPEQLEEYVNNKRSSLGIEDRFSIDQYIGQIDQSLIKQAS